MADPTCHYCDRPAVEECPTCGRLYCQDHGEDVCLRCMSPEAATPSVMVFRGSIVALLVASLAAIFLVIRPPESKSTSSQVRTISTPTQQTSPTATPTPPGSGPSRTATAAGGTAKPATPATSATGTDAAGTAVASPSAAAKTYTVQAGDTISSIAVAHGTDTETILGLNPDVKPETLLPGTVLKLP
ncbi:MAG: LysM peptidoglycan-binding domain-containing protein [Dehalococcoidia bacterium]|nr:LysM peptidoglycan-binding domain-containing protein [Dehalococcoidia bacterium]